MAYLYRHIRTDKNTPFYIGIGTDDRFGRAHSRHGRNPMWNRVVSKTNYEVEILMDGISLEFAKEKEVEFIQLYGRMNIGGGTLCNITGGGDGGYNPPEEFRERLRIRNKKGRYNLGKRHSDDTKKSIGKSSSVRNSGRNNPSYKGRIKAFKEGVLVGEYDGIYNCAKGTGANVSSVSSCLNGKRKSSNGHTFKREV